MSCLIICYKVIMKLPCAVLFAALLPHGASAASPREELKAVVELIKKSPADQALREKAIALAQKIEPAPAPSAEARRRMVRGGTAVKEATSSSDYRMAAAEFEKALLEAPWWGDAYYNLAVAQDKAEDFAAALASLKLARLALPDSKDAEELAFAVEFRMEKAASPEAIAAKQKVKDDAFLKSLDGALFAYNHYGTMEFQLRIQGNRALYWNRRIAMHYCLCGEDNCDGPMGAEKYCGSDYVLAGQKSNVPWDSRTSTLVEISDDGRTLKMTQIYNGAAGTPEVYTRR